MKRVFLLLMLLAPAGALEWAYDKQLHAAGGALGAYAIADVLERTTDLSPLARWGIATLTMTAAGWIYEEVAGVREPGDAQATTIGACMGATGQVGLSIALPRDGFALGWTWRLP